MLLDRLSLFFGLFEPFGALPSESKYFSVKLELISWTWALFSLEKVGHHAGTVNLSLPRLDRRLFSP